MTCASKKQDILIKNIRREREPIVERSEVRLTGKSVTFFYSVDHTRYLIIQKIVRIY